MALINYKRPLLQLMIMSMDLLCYQVIEVCSCTCTKPRIISVYSYSCNVHDIIDDKQLVDDNYG